MPLLFITALLLWNPFNWWGHGKDWETQQEVQAIDGLVQDEETFSEMDEMGLIPETPWGETDEHEAVEPPPPPTDNNDGPKWLKWLGL